MKKSVHFTHTVYEKGLAIAHIKFTNDAGEVTKQEYAVVRYPDLDPNSKWYGTWHHAVNYFNSYYDAKDCFIATVNKDRKNRGEKGYFYLAQKSPTPSQERSN